MLTKDSKWEKYVKIQAKKKKWTSTGCKDHKLNNLRWLLLQTAVFSSADAPRISLLKLSDFNLIVLQAYNQVSQVEIEYTILFIFLN